MDTLVIAEEEDGLFSVVLPACDSSILRAIVDPDVPHVWILDYPMENLYPWLEEQMPALLNRQCRFETFVVRNIELDLSANTGDFLDNLPVFVNSGLTVVQAARPLPRTLVLKRISAKARGHVFREVGILFEFCLPHPHENALLTSVSRNFLETVVSSYCGGR